MAILVTVMLGVEKHTCMLMTAKTIMIRVTSAAETTQMTFDNWSWTWCSSISFVEFGAIVNTSGTFVGTLALVKLAIEFGGSVCELTRTRMLSCSTIIERSREIASRCSRVRHFAFGHKFILTTEVRAKLGNNIVEQLFALTIHVTATFFDLNGKD